MRINLRKQILQDRKKRKYFEEQLEMLNKYKALIDMQESIHDLGKLITPPAQMENETHNLDAQREQFVKQCKIYDMLLEQEINRIFIRAINLETYGRDIVVEDITFLEKYFKAPYDKMSERVQDYYEALLQHKDPDVKQFARTHLNLQ